jgi:hypothetical protein
VNIPGGGLQTFLIALTPTAPFSSTDVQFRFDCANTDPASVIPGVNTLLLTASAGPTPDIVALAATATNDGIVDIPGVNGTGAFSVATVNVGATGQIVVSADTGSTVLPVTVFLCQTNPATGQCVTGLFSSLAGIMNASSTFTFGIFVNTSGGVPFNPAVNRIFVRFKDMGGVTRGSTSVAARTQ